VGEAAGEHRLTVGSWSPHPGAKLSVLRCSLERFAARRGSYRGGGACGICVGAPPRGEALGFALFARTIRREARLLQGGRCLRHLCRSPAPGRSSRFCGVRSNDSPRGAAPTGGGVLRSCVGAPPRGEAFSFALFARTIRREARLLQGGGVLRSCVGAPPRGEAFSFAVFFRFAAGHGS